MALSRVRLYVLGLILTTLVMSIAFGAIYIFLHEINILYIVGVMAFFLVIWGVNTYYLIKIIDEEERVSAKPGEG